MTIASLCRTCWARSPHAAGLAKIGILDRESFQVLHEGPGPDRGALRARQFNLEQGDEDVHTKIENWLTSNVGDPNRDPHRPVAERPGAGRPRLYTREAVLPVYQAILSACEALHSLAGGTSIRRCPAIPTCSGRCSRL
ncbi:MAG: hypothetical protein R2849_10690 [Thermomicrobiales bacterium]